MEKDAFWIELATDYKILRYRQRNVNRILSSNYNLNTFRNAWWNLGHLLDYIASGLDSAVVNDYRPDKTGRFEIEKGVMLIDLFYAYKNDELKYIGDEFKGYKRPRPALNSLTPLERDYMQSCLTALVQFVDRIEPLVKTCDFRESVVLIKKHLGKFKIQFENVNVRENFTF